MVHAEFSSLLEPWVLILIFSIFLMSSWFGYTGSGELKLIRTDATKIIKKAKFIFIALHLSFYHYPSPRPADYPPVFPMPSWCLRPPLMLDHPPWKRLHALAQQNYLLSVAISQPLLSNTLIYSVHLNGLVSTCLSQLELLYVTRYHRLGDSNNSHVFLMVLKDGKSKIKAPTELVCGEDTAWLVDGHLLAVSSHGREEKRRGSKIFQVS